MRSDGILKHAAVAGALALVFYILAFGWIQHRRQFRGPWEVTFSADAAGHPALEVREPALGISQRIVFPAANAGMTNFSQTVRFPEAVTQIPFGKMLFQDPTFLPGTVTMQQFGHEIELLPRVMKVDRKEMAWGSGTVLELR